MKKLVTALALFAAIMLLVSPAAFADACLCDVDIVSVLRVTIAEDCAGIDTGTATLLVSVNFQSPFFVTVDVEAASNLELALLKAYNDRIADLPANITGCFYVTLNSGQNYDISLVGLEFRP